MKQRILVALMLCIGVLAAVAGPSAAQEPDGGIFEGDGESEDGGFFDDEGFFENESEGDEVYINGGGGVEFDGSDGLLLRFNASDYGSIAGGNGTSHGSDQLAYRNTTQHCCDGAAPMINIGGTLYGDAGPALWSGVSPSMTFEVESMTGTAGTEIGTEAGSGSAVLRYTARHNDLDYVVIRTVSYTYPNNSFLDEYEIIVPEGNTDEVKFYLGGDTAPGNTDWGIGVETTVPVRTIYTVNPQSEIQMGYGEVPGSAPFDGAVVGGFYDPYDAVIAGQDIGFSIDTGDHDAGIMMQWTLGSTPGTYDRALTHVVGARGAALSAQFTDGEIEAGATTDLNIEVLNTGTAEAADVDFTVSLPTGLLTSGDALSDCGGTLSAADGSTTIMLEAGVVASATNCVITVPVTAADAGEYTIDADSASGLDNIENAVGSSTLTVTAVPEPEPEPEPEADPVCTRVLTGDYAGDSGIDGLVSRLYMASFVRQPEAAGHDYWIEALTSGGWTTDQAAGFFTSSDEFTSTYGDLDDDAFVEQLYNNVMCRSADDAGAGYWLGELDDGMSRARMVLLFAESPEFKTLTASA